MLFFYFGTLFFYINFLAEDNKLCLYYTGTYPVMDILMMMITCCVVKSVKNSVDEIKDNPIYEKKKIEIDSKLKEIAYMPLDYESDVIEEEDN